MSPILAGLFSALAFAGATMAAARASRLTGAIPAVAGALLVAFILFRERLAGRQVAGIVLVVTGIALLGALAG